MIELRNAVAGSAGDASGDVLFSMENITASAYDDYVYGNGADNLHGGSGNDIFVFNHVSDTTTAQTDVITDFISGVDMLDFIAIGLTDHSKFNFSFNSANNLTTVDYDGNNDFELYFSGDTEFNAGDLV